VLRIRLFPVAVKLTVSFGVLIRSWGTSVERGSICRRRSVLCRSRSLVLSKITLDQNCCGYSIFKVVESVAKEFVTQGRLEAGDELSDMCVVVCLVALTDGDETVGILGNSLSG